MTRKNICWVTPDCFLDVDLPVIKELYNRYDIYWLITLNSNNHSDDKKFILEQTSSLKGLEVKFFQMKYRIRSPKHLLEAIKVIKFAKSFHPDLYYISEQFVPLGFLLYKMMLPIDKCVVACHNVTTPQGAKNEVFANFYTNQWLKTFKNIQTFSESQCEALNAKYRNKNALMAHLILKDYGEPQRVVNKLDLDYVRFLVFGNIVWYKRIDLLLNAVNILWDKGYKNFRVRIAGSCKSWEANYAPLIKHPELYELDIRRIPNEDVANLFVDSHYFVMPYQDIAQSGAITVAYRYNLPAIVSDIPPFQEFVQDGVTGFTFHTQDAQALADKMAWILDNHLKIYPDVCSRLRDYTDKTLSTIAIIQKYCAFFDKL